MSEYENFDRQYRLIAGKAGNNGFMIGEADGGKVAPLHINFSFQKTDLTTQNTGRVTIWNLNKSQLATLEQKNCVLSLKAGYGKMLAQIFTGIVSHAVTSMDGADRMTDIEVIDNLIEIRNTYITISYKGKVSWETIFNDTAAKMGVSIVYAHDVKFTSVTKGFSYIGQAKGILDKGCSSCGLTWSIQNGIIHIKKKGGTMSKEAYLISADTGMIGIPARYKEAATEEGQSDLIGWQVQFLLNGAISVDDYVKLESKVVTGYFRVYAMEYTGDNYSGDWMCRATLLEVTS